MEAMLKFLRIMFLAPDTDTKRNILNVAYYWFIKHLNPKQQRKSKETLHKEIKNLVVEHRLMSVVVL